MAELNEVTDLLYRAKILLGEGLRAEAKKALRQVLILDSRNLIASQLLGQLNNEELQQLLSGAQELPSATGAGGPHRFSFSEKGFDPDDVLAQLEQDLDMSPSLGDLSLFRESGLNQSGTVVSGSETQTSLPNSWPNSCEDFFGQIEKDLSQSTFQDWLDLGIAFMEMDLFGLSIRLFKGARHRARDPQDLLSVVNLLALSHILNGQPYEAVSELYPILEDSEVKQEDKIDLFYLMGRAYEAVFYQDSSQSTGELATSYFGSVLSMDLKYRDAEYRFHKIQQKKKML